MVVATATPFTVHGTGRVRGGAVEVDASESSQIVSGLLLAAARFDEGIDLALTGGVPSMPHVDMTVTTLRAHGVEVIATDRGWRVPPGPIAARDVVVEPDLSNAAPFLAAALVTGGTGRRSPPSRARSWTACSGTWGRTWPGRATACR